jgi:Dyp-type peroxidase family
VRRWGPRRQQRDGAPIVAELADIQGNILRGYRLQDRRPPVATHLLVGFDSTEGARSLLTAVVDDVTTAAAVGDRSVTALNVGVTFSGLRRLGVPAAVLDGFPDAFTQTTRERAAALGDVGASAPEHWEEHYGTGTVHLVLTVHGATAVALAAETGRLAAVVRQHGGAVLREEPANLLRHMAEHFGYADGMAQPALEGGYPADGAVRGGGVPLPDGTWRPLRLGEFVLGYPDEDGQVDERPTPELVHNGSYLVLRKLEQDVGAFRERLDAAAVQSGLPTETVAAKAVGRWRDGVALAIAPDRQPTGDLAGESQTPSNDFRYLPHDADGAVCPQGAHIRRVNPRDAIDFGGTVKDSGQLTRRHRIIRRGMPYGPPYDEEPDVDRGLMFLCFQADLVRQFETIQASWCCDGDAFGLGNDQDFLLGNDRSASVLKIPRRGEAPLLVTAQPDLVVTRGSEYFLVPGIRALRRLADGGFARGHWTGMADR